LKYYTDVAGAGLERPTALDAETEGTVAQSGSRAEAEAEAPSRPPTHHKAMLKHRLRK